MALERDRLYRTEPPLGWDEFNQRVQKDLTKDKARGPQQPAEPTPREGKVPSQQEMFRRFVNESSGAQHAEGTAKRSA